MNIFRKFILCGSLLVGLFAVSAKADTDNFFNFNGGLGNIGNTDTFHAGAAVLILSGYSGPSLLSAMYMKNLGVNETGIGLANNSIDEIEGTDFVQMDLGLIEALHPTSLMLSLSSIQPPDAYTVFGSNVAGVEGTVIGTNQTSFNFDLTGDQSFRYISVGATLPGDSVLIDNLDVRVPSPTPEPSTFGMFGIGLGLLLFGKKLALIVRRSPQVQSSL